MATYEFFSETSGRSVGNNGLIFPLLKNLDNRIHLVGTAFFVSDDIFITAKHNIEDVLDGKGEPSCPLYGCHFREGNRHIFRPVQRVYSSRLSDISLGFFDEITDTQGRNLIQNDYLILTADPPQIGEKIVTYAFPEVEVKGNDVRQEIWFWPNFYEGKFEEHHPHGRDRYLMPFPCYRGSMNLLGGASGGPVFNERGRVFGVNITAIVGSNAAYFARVNELLPLCFEHIEFEIKGEVLRNASFADLIRRGYIKFDSPLDQ